MRLFTSVVFLASLGMLCQASFAQDEVNPQPRKDKTLVDDTTTLSERVETVVIQAEAASDQNALHAKFKKLFTGARLTGQFTIDGKPMTDLKQETYEIVTVEKQGKGDVWIIKARIKYGKHDLTVPVPLEVKWAGETPVLTLDDLTIPGMGTFSARVVLHKDKYAGTWQHDNVGGHMFGMIKLPTR